MAFGWKKMGDAINPSAVGPQNKKPAIYGLAALGHAEGEIAREAVYLVAATGAGTGLGYVIGKDWKSATIGGLAGLVLWALFGHKQGS